MTHNNNLLLKKYTEYLIPTMVTTAALSLNEFIDSMLVSKLLGTQAMAVVNLGMPIMLLLAAVVALGGRIFLNLSLIRRYWIGRTRKGTDGYVK